MRSPSETQMMLCAMAPSVEKFINCRLVLVHEVISAWAALINPVSY